MALGRNTNAPLRFVEACKQTLDKGYSTLAVLVNLSTAVDCLTHGLLIAKLDPYRFSKVSLRLIHSYLREISQMVKVNGSYSSWRLTDTTCGVPQKYVLGPVPFYVCEG